MAETTAIEWCDATFNPWIGCTRVSPACDDCYAARSTPARTMGIAWGPGEPRRRTAESTWAAPLKWAKAAAKTGRRPRVFCASLADWLDNEVPIAWLVDLLDLVRRTPELDWLLLSKRIGNWRLRMKEAIGHIESTHLWNDNQSLQTRAWTADWLNGTPPANVWLGATVVTQKEADRDVPKLLAVPARVRFLSIEPMLGPIDLRVPRGAPRDPSLHWIHWVICGGESGPRARPMHPDWARSLRDQCAAAGVPFLFKQWGEWTMRGPESMGYPVIDGVPTRRITDTGQNGRDLASTGDNQVIVQRIGKAAAGRLLDGRTHDEFPA